MNDRALIKSAIDNFYGIISGKAGELRDWDKMRSLFIAGTYVVICPAGTAGDQTPKVLDVSTYLDNLGRFLENNDFYEFGLIYQTEIFGNIASVVSTYEARRSPEDNDPLKRGVNFIHLCYDNDRWLITSMIWRDEDEDCPLPDKYN